MIKAQAYVETEKASRYLQQLCKHFKHKVPAEWDEKKGRTEFPFGLCLMEADDQQLTITCEAPTAEAFNRMRFVLDDHLERFAWKEELKLSWSDQNELDDTL